MRVENQVTAARVLRTARPPRRYDLIGTRSGAPEVFSWTVVRALALGLGHCLAHGVVHRDVKPEVRHRRPTAGASAARMRTRPELPPPFPIRGPLVAQNILVSTSDGVAVEGVKLCDFGLCAIAPLKSTPSAEHLIECGTTPTVKAVPKKMWGGESPTTVMLNTSSAPTAPDCGERDWQLYNFSGSPGFVAPEVRAVRARDDRKDSARDLTRTAACPLRAPQIVLADGEAYDGRSVDCWSLGCVALELVLGHKLFDITWMAPYASKTMAGDEFGPKLASAVATLRTLPELYETAPSAGAVKPPVVRTSFTRSSDATVSAPSEKLNAIGEFVLALLQINHEERTPMARVPELRWLATVPEVSGGPLTKAMAADIASRPKAEPQASGGPLTKAIAHSAVSEKEEKEVAVPPRAAEPVEAVAHP